MNIRAKIDAAAMELATRRNQAHCAIAYALAAAYPHIRRPKVNYNTIRFTDVDTRLRYIYRTPEPLREFIAAWDNGESPEPPLVQLTQRHLIRINEPRDRPASDVLKPRPRGSANGPKAPSNHRPLPNQGQAA